jgi:prepilin-type N-terminal cleavage/methylation domain-containing protein
MSKFRISSALGFSLFEVIIVAAILSVVAAFSGGLVTNIIAAQKRNELGVELNSIREIIRTTLKNRLAWENTLLAAGPGKENAVPPALTPFAIRDANNIRLFNGYNSANATEGFNPRGQRCSSYPSLACPVRLLIQWRKDTSTCNANIPNCKPEVEVIVSATMAADTPYAGMSTEKYSLKVRMAGNSYSEDRTFCGAGDVVTSFDAQGRPTCTDAASVLAAGTPTPPAVGGPSTGGPSTGGPSTGGPSTGAPSTGAPAKSPAPKGK